MSLIEECQCCSSPNNLYKCYANFTKTLYSCFAIEINLKNTKICIICITKLKETNAFRELILQTQKSLRFKEKILNQPSVIETEKSSRVDDDDDDDLSSCPNAIYFGDEIDSDHSETEEKQSSTSKKENCNKTELLDVTPAKSIKLELLKEEPKKNTTLVDSKICSARSNKLKTAKKSGIIKLVEIKITPAISIKSAKTKHSLGAKKSKTTEEKTSEVDTVEILKKLNRKTLICYVCKEKLPSFNSLSNHINTHYPNFICEICGKVFLSKRRLQIHSVLHLTLDWPCPECGEKYRTRSSLKSHRQRIHLRSKLNKCNQCEERFNYHYQKMQHMADVHGQTERNYKCPYCDKTYLTASLLGKHRTATHNRERSHICDTCGSGFYRRTTLVHHIKIHTGERPYICDLCPKTFIRKSLLREHTMKHHGKKQSHIKSVHASKVP